MFLLCMIIIEISIPCSIWFQINLKNGSKLIRECTFMEVYCYPIAIYLKNYRIENNLKTTIVRLYILHYEYEYHVLSNIRWITNHLIFVKKKIQWEKCGLILFSFNNFLSSNSYKLHKRYKIRKGMNLMNKMRKTIDFSKIIFHFNLMLCRSILTEELHFPVTYNLKVQVTIT